MRADGAAVRSVEGEERPQTRAVCITIAKDNDWSQTRERGYHIVEWNFTWSRCPGPKSTLPRLHGDRILESILIMSETAEALQKGMSGEEGGENKHKLQCPRIKERTELYKERKKEEAKEKVEEIIKG
jgi:hypothetical protein